MNDADAILEFIADEAELPEGLHLDADTSLFKEHLLDSMNLSALIAFVEDTFRIKVRPMDIAFDHLDTVNLILAFIAKRRAASV